ncbi:33 kDa inner dynein arm light chain, axonemal [Eumeta japonica]|uniref:33 kDa inner dynein arm light chain, axonemal n=1 Tax=Eumeta variegata TaxID=151549 RepID=A0A4C1UJ94_EUMVA|nr:33 kDa inner dynein arm light chain, axonemal [Eumeta japonica]
MVQWLPAYCDSTIPPTLLYVGMFETCILRIRGPRVKHSDTIVAAIASSTSTAQIAPFEIPPPGGSAAPCMPVEAKRETEEILNSILPPKEWEESGQIWTQKISATPATRLDVINLQEMLDTRLQQRQARETGICPVRRQLYTQCFDELIRQVTINCAERGLLLLRIRDEARMTMEAYQTLYCSSIAFGMRKALQAEQGKSDLQDQVVKLEEERASFERQCAELKQKAEQLERRAAELKAAEEKRHQEELLALKKTNAQLKASRSIFNMQISMYSKMGTIRRHHRAQKIVYFITNVSSYFLY